MSLINPTTANYLDRLSILELKIQHGEAAGKPVDHFVRERGQVLGKLAAATPKLEHVILLTVVNARLWQAEDEMRALRQKWDTSLTPDSTGSTGEIYRTETLGPQIVPVALQIQSLNDERARIIAAINTHAGEPPTAKEKL